MPIPPPFPLFLLHPFHPNPATTYAARAGASSLLAAALARDLYRRTPEWIREDDLWKSLLESEETKDGHVDEMASLTAVIQKLQGLIVTGYEKLGSERRRMRRRRTALSGSTRKGKRLTRKSTSECLCQYKESMCQYCNSCRDEEASNVESSVTSESALNDSITPLEWHAALLAYIQLSNQIRERYPMWRDRMYEEWYSVNCNPVQVNNNKEQSPDNDQRNNTNNERRRELELDACKAHDNTVTASKISELKQMLDYAVWAYEPDEEALRNLLLGNQTADTDEKKVESSNNGYQLIVHRTTSYIEPSSQSNDNQTVKNSSKKLRKPPGRVGYYVAISHAKKELLIGMKGTSTLEDILTDCCGRALRLDLENDPHHPNELFNCDDSSRNTDGDEIEGSCEEYHNANNNDYVIEYEKDKTLHVSLISGNNDLSNSEIEVNLIEVGLSHHDESIEISMPLEQAAQGLNLNTRDAADSPPRTPRQQITPNRKSSRENLSTLSSPQPAENILLVPTSQALGSGNLSNSNDKLTLPAEQSNDEAIESHGIEMQLERTTKVRGVHEGLLHCAQQLFSEISPLIEEFAVSKGYVVVCTGHSMGAGTSALLALLIRGKYPELVMPQRGVERVHAYAFAPPPVMDRATSLACQHYVTSIVNNSDIIPRSSLTNLDILLTMLEAVRNSLVDWDMNPGRNANTRNPNDSCQNPKNIISSMVALFRKLSEGTDGELIIEPEELQQVFKEAVSDAILGEDAILWDEEGSHHLLVPGSVLLMYEPWSSMSETNVTHAHDTAQDQSMQKSERSDLEANTEYQSLWTNGTATMLKGFEIGAGGNIVTDHLTSSYYRALASFEKLQH